MPVIVVDGPEKSGKTTFIEMLVDSLGPRTMVRHHGPPTFVEGQPLDIRYSAELQADLANISQYAIYDRCWASDSVYDKFLRRPGSRLAHDQFLGEWMYSRAVATVGARVMLLGPSDAHLYARRTPDDIPIPAHIERQAFQQYAEAWGWDRCMQTPKPSDMPMTVSDVIELARRRALGLMDLRIGIRDYTGPSYPQVLFVGETTSRKDDLKGAFLPFSSRQSTAFAESLGLLALKCGWVSWLAATDELLSRARLIVTLGPGARDRVTEFRSRGTSRAEVLDAHRPSWLYQWGAAAGLLAPTEIRVRRAVFRYLGLKHVA